MTLDFLNGLYGKGASTSPTNNMASSTSPTSLSSPAITPTTASSTPATPPATQPTTPQMPKINGALSPTLNDKQIRENIDYMLSKGIPKEQVQAYVNNYKKGSDGNYVLNTPPPTPTTPSFMDKTFGNAPSDGIVSGLVKSTIGSEGAGGLIAKPIVSVMTSGAEKPLAESNSVLADVTTSLLKKINSLPEGDPARNHLMDIVNQNQKALGIGNDTLKTLGASQETQGQNLGNVLNTEATVLAGANPATFAQKMLLSTGIGAAYGAGQKLNENASPLSRSTSPWLAGRPSWLP